MTVPEASVNEDSPTASTIGEIGGAGKVAAIDPVPMSKSGYGLSYANFSGSVSLADAGHAKGCMGVCPKSHGA
jgi:hypothetical protein